MSVRVLEGVNGRVWSMCLVPGAWFRVLLVALCVVLLYLAPGTWHQALYSQHLENSATGTVRNNGTIRFRDDNGKYKNDAPYANITNAVVEFAGSDNEFTDLNGNPVGPTSLGHDPSWRVPGMVRYADPQTD